MGIIQKCKKCGNQIFPMDRCTCNRVSPGSSHNPSRGDGDKWCQIPDCGSRIKDGRCMNYRCRSNG